MATLNIRKLKHKVEWCLKNRPATKDDDTYLVLSVYKNFYRADFEDLLFKSLRSLEIDSPSELYNSTGKMGKLPSFESIGRCRRKFQEEGLYVASDETNKRRGRKVREVVSDIEDFGSY